MKMKMSGAVFFIIETSHPAILADGDGVAVDGVGVWVLVMALVLAMM